MNPPTTFRVTPNRSSRSRVWRRPASLVADLLPVLHHDDIAVLARIEWRDPRGLLERLGPDGRAALVIGLGDRLSRELPGAEVSADGSASLLYSIVLSGVSATDAAELLRRTAARLLNDREQPVAGLTPLIGLVPFGPTSDPVAVVDAAETALRQALTHLDLTPVICRPDGGSTVAAPGLPAAHAAMAAVGLSLPIVAALVGGFASKLVSAPATALCILLGALWASLRVAEGFASRFVPRPKGIDRRPTMASFTAIVTASEPRQLPAALETAASLLGHPNGTDLQVILAHGSVRDNDAEALAMWAGRDKRFLPVRVATEAQTAALVNAALESATGTVTAIVNRGDRIEPASWNRANGWLNAGWDLVQGSVVPARSPSRLAGELAGLIERRLRPSRLAGSAALFDVTIGDAGTVFWRTDVLRRVRYRHEAASPQWDCVTRAVSGGRRSGYDGSLRTSRMAPSSVRDLWRARWLEARSACQALAQSRQVLCRPRSLPMRRWLGVLVVVGIDHVLPLALLTTGITAIATIGASRHLPDLPHSVALRAALVLVGLTVAWRTLAVFHHGLLQPSATGRSGAPRPGRAAAPPSRWPARLGRAFLAVPAAAAVALMGVGARLSTLAEAVGNAPADLELNAGFTGEDDVDLAAGADG